jgi:hypothetical protein
VTAANLEKYFAAADGFIVGSEFKQGGNWARPVDAKRVERFMAMHRRLKP